MTIPKQSAWNRIIHPACHPEPKSKLSLARAVVVFVTFYVIAAIIWPSWWLLPLAMILGVSLVTHPFCAITGLVHPPGYRHKLVRPESLHQHEDPRPRP